MPQVLLESAVVGGPRYWLGKGGGHAENVERCFAEALHQFAGKDFAYRAVFRRRDAVRCKFRAMHHQLTTDLNFGSDRSHFVADHRIITERWRVAFPRCHVPAQLLEGVRNLEHDATADKAALERESPCQYLPSAIDLAADVFMVYADIVVEDVGKGAVVHCGRGPDRDAGRLHRDDEHADSGMWRFFL